MLIAGAAAGAAAAAARPQLARLPFTAAARVGVMHPSPHVLVAVGAVAGLLVAPALWPIVSWRPRRSPETIKPEDVADSLGLPLLADVVAFDRPPQPAASSLSGSAAFAQLRRSVDFANLRHDARSILITSADRQEGRSTTIAHLAVAFGRTGRRVALIDLDLQHPTLHTLFGVDQSPGVSDLVRGAATLEESVRAVPLGEDVPRLSTVANPPLTPPGRLYLVTAGGGGPAAPGAPLTSKRLDELLRFLDGYFDLVLIDGPIAATACQATGVTDVIGGVLVLVNPTLAGDGWKGRLKTALERIPAPKLGIIATSAPVDTRTQAG